MSEAATDAPPEGERSEPKGRSGSRGIAAQRRPPGSPFGKWLKQVRVAKDLTIDELATASGLNRTTVQGWETRDPPGPNTGVGLLDGLARGLDIELGYVLYKLGHDIGKEGVHMGRLDRVEGILERLDPAEPKIRRALAEAGDFLDRSLVRELRPPDLLDAKLTLGLVSEALRELDLITERLREGRVQS